MPLYRCIVDGAPEGDERKDRQDQTQEKRWKKEKAQGKDWVIGLQKEDVGFSEITNREVWSFEPGKGGWKDVAFQLLCGEAELEGEWTKVYPVENETTVMPI